MIDYPSPNFSVSIVSTFEDVFPNLNYQHSFSLRTISCHSSTLPHIEIGASRSHGFNVRFESSVEWAKLGMKRKLRCKIKRLTHHMNWVVEREPERKMETSCDGLHLGSIPVLQFNETFFLPCNTVCLSFLKLLCLLLENKTVLLNISSNWGTENPSDGFR